MSIDEIWKQFGDDVVKIAIEFEPGKNTWCVKFKTPLGGTHVERDMDMIKAAENTLNWYKNSHTPAYVAEALFMVLSEIENATKKQEHQNSFTEDILEACKLKDEFMHIVEGELIWNDAYKQKPIPEQKPVQEQKSSAPAKPQKKKPEPEPTNTAEAPTDGFPPYFMKDDSGFSGRTECWGYDIYGKRAHVVLDQKNPQNCKIDNSLEGLNSDTNVVEISENEYNEYYDNVTNTMTAISMGFGVDDFSKYKVIKD